MMRTKNSILNFATSLIIKLVTLVLSFISRTIFISTLGASYLGVQGLMTNVMSMLSIAELGVGTAITFSLYKPLANSDTNTVAALMAFYKRAYRFIGNLIFIIGFILVFFIDLVVKDYGDVENIRLIFFLYVLTTGLPYFINYKQALIKADQKEYKLATINLSFSILLVLMQIIILYLTGNFILYLASNLLITLVQTIYINFKVTQMYPTLKSKTNKKLPKEELNEVIKNVKAMFFHKIGDFSINSTDNILISSFISLKTVGLFSNYTMIINTVNSMISLFFNSLTASMGNLIATSSNLKKMEVFNVTNFISFWIYGFTTVSFFCLLNPTIELWLGREYLLSEDVMLVVLINYYLTGMRMPVGTVKSAAGLYDVDKYSPLIQSAINLVLSILLAPSLGLLGIFMGTLISSLALPLWQRPYLIYKYVFHTTSKVYFKTFIKYLLALIIMGLTTSSIIRIFFSDRTLLSYLNSLMVCLIIPNVIIILLFYKTIEFKTIIRILKSLLVKRGL